jgi:hypothetical protein
MDKPRIPFEQVVADLKKIAPGRVTTVCYEDFAFLHSIGALDWSFAPTLSFQAFIRDHGTPEEKLRLHNLHVGYQDDELIAIYKATQK